MILASRMAYENYAVPSGCRRYTHIDGEDATAKPSTPTIPTARRLPLSRSPPRSGAMPQLGTSEGGRPSDQAIDPRLSACIILYRNRSEEHTSELQSLMRISYAVFCLKQKTTIYHHTIIYSL